MREWLGNNIIYYIIFILGAVSFQYPEFEYIDIVQLAFAYLIFTEFQSLSNQIKTLEAVNEKFDRIEKKIAGFEDRFKHLKKMDDKGIKKRP